MDCFPHSMWAETPCSECALNALAIDKPLEYARLYLEGGMQLWVNAADSLELY